MQLLSGPTDRRSALLSALPSLDTAEGQRLFADYEASALALERYCPRPMANLRVALFKANEGPTGDRGWSPYFPTARIFSVPGDHYSLLRAPHVGTLARKLGEFLDDDN
jgi:thioesterase domain-containing protein